MAHEYFLYRTDIENTLVDRSATSFAPYPPNTNEVYIEYFIPSNQPLYLYRYDGNTIVVNSDENINKYLDEQNNNVEPEFDDPIHYGDYTGYTATTDNRFDNIEQDLIELSGSTPSPLTTKGDLYTFSTGNTRLPVGTDGSLLMADSNEENGLNSRCVKIYWHQNRE